MTRYHCGPRPRELPAFPDLHLDAPSASALVAALHYLDATDNPYYLDLDHETIASERPGAEQDLLLTDRAFAKRVRDRCVRALADAGEARLKPDLPGASRDSPPVDDAGAVDGDGIAEMPHAVRTPRLVTRNTVRFNDQVLRTGAFADATLGAVLRPVGDREGFEVVVEEQVLTQRHLDVLMFLLSRVPNEVDTNAPLAVPVPERRMLVQLGWGVNTRTYQSLRRALRELNATRLTLRDMSRRQGVQLKAAQLLRVTELGSGSGGGRTSALRAIETVELTPGLLKLATTGRLAVVDLRERWSLPRGLLRWLHAFVSTQRRGLVRTYPALELCAAGGLRAERPADLLAALRKALRLLEGPQPGSPSSGAVITSGWAVEKREADWLVTMTRSPGPQTAG